MTPNFIKACSLLLKEEGGLVDDPKDPGGLTNMGVSQRAYPFEDIRAMTKNRAMEIYHHDYWMKIRGDSLPYCIAVMVFDCAVNTGVARAVKFLQESVLVPVDGKIGDMTLNAVMANPKIHIIELFTKYRIDFYMNLPTWPRFGKGWKTRAERVKSEALGHVNA